MNTSVYHFMITQQWTYLPRHNSAQQWRELSIVQSSILVSLHETEHAVLSTRTGNALTHIQHCYHSSASIERKYRTRHICMEGNLENLWINASYTFWEMGCQHVLKFLWINFTISTCQLLKHQLNFWINWNTSLGRAVSTPNKKTSLLTRH